MGLRQDIRTRLQLIQSNIAGIQKAELNVPVAITASACPLFINFFGQTIYTGLQGNGVVSRADLSCTMRLYLGIPNTITAMENKADELIPLVETAFLGNTMLEYNNQPMNIGGFTLLTNSGLVSQQYAVQSSANETNNPFYAVVEFPTIISLNLRNC